MSFTVFSYNATVLLIQPNPTQPNPTQPMDGPNPCPSLRQVALVAVTQILERFQLRRIDDDLERMKTEYELTMTSIIGPLQCLPQHTLNHNHLVHTRLAEKLLHGGFRQGRYFQGGHWALPTLIFSRVGRVTPLLAPLGYMSSLKSCFCGYFSAQVWHILRLFVTGRPGEFQHATQFESWRLLRLSVEHKTRK